MAKWKKAWERAFRPAKYKGVRVTSDMADVVIHMPRYVLMGRRKR